MHKIQDRPVVIDGQIVVTPDDVHRLDLWTIASSMAAKAVQFPGDRSSNVLEDPAAVWWLHI